MQSSLPAAITATVAGMDYDAIMCGRRRDARDGKTTRDRHTMTRMIAALAAALTAAACNVDGLAERLRGEEKAGVEATTSTSTAASEFDASPEDVAPPPRQVYYDLTLYDWYRLGQPLLVGGVPHELAGIPVRILDPLDLAGTYGGVDYYTTGEGRDTVFVPVYENYWQPFARSVGPPAAGG